MDAMDIVMDDSDISFIISAIYISFLEQMDYRSITDELIELLTEQGIVIRRDKMGSGGGGLCVIDGRKVFFFNNDSSAFELAVSCAHAAAEAILDPESIYIKPAVRDFIDKYGQKE